MNPEKYNPGDEVSNPVAKCLCQQNNMVNDLHNNDALQFWTAKASHKFMDQRGKGVMDLVLYHLFAMELFDWMAPNDHLNQTTLVMHHTTVMGTRLFSQIVENNMKVLYPLSLFVVERRLENPSQW